MNKQGCKRQTHLTVKYFGTCGKIYYIIVQSFENVIILYQIQLITSSLLIVLIAFQIHVALVVVGTVTRIHIV